MLKPAFYPAEILLPEGTPAEKWAVLACDQFTSQPEYWEQANDIVGDAPSTLRITLPELYLEQEGVEQRVEAIHKAMHSYLAAPLTRKVQGMVYVRRSFANGSIREGLVGCIDLEDYSYVPGAKALIRPSENTVVERIPPRLAVRRGAVLETPHILMLIDDAQKVAIESIGKSVDKMQPLYDVELMLGGGRLQGWALEDTKAIEEFLNPAIRRLAQPERFATRYGSAQSDIPFMMAVGDGNHSLATAKAYWEEVKPNVPEALRENHPTRYCLVELENIQSPAIEIEPIHRVLFNVDEGDLLRAATEFADKKGAELCFGEKNKGFVYQIATAGKGFALTLQNSTQPLAVGALELFLESYLPHNPHVRVDYVHGEAAVRQLSDITGNVGILLPPLNKSDIFRGVALGGVLPRKTFSMGHAEQKRYYMECRKICAK